MKRRRCVAGVAAGTAVGAREARSAMRRPGGQSRHAKTRREAAREQLRRGMAEAGALCWMRRGRKGRELVGGGLEGGVLGCAVVFGVREMSMPVD